MTEMYHSLAAVYDQVQAVDYASWAEYLCRLDKSFNRRVSKGDGQDGRPLLLDLGCGTGGICLEMAGRGYDPIGIDRSAAMLNQARDKAHNSDNPSSRSCLFLHQDIRRFELYGTVDLIVCLLDTVNHLTHQADVRRLFKLCSHYLNPGGLFIFDLATWHHLAETRGNNLFFVDQPAFTLIWQHRFLPARKLSRAELTLYREETDGCYRRSDEQILERYYSLEEISSFMEDTLVHPGALLGDQTMRQPQANSERIFHVYRKQTVCANVGGETG